MHNFNILLQLVTFISVAIGAIGLLWGIYSYKKQMNAQVFLEYTRRYAAIMDSFPREMRSLRLNLYSEAPKSSEELTLSVLKYLNLCSEEFYLYHKRILNSEIWRIWEMELVRTLKSPLFRREWKILKSEFSSYPQFREYVDKHQS